MSAFQTVGVPDFIRAYQSTAKRGQSDEVGGCEYERVLQEWIDAGKPAGIKAFVREAANRPPSALQIAK